jgi:hypothetical protein
MYIMSKILIVAMRFIVDLEVIFGTEFVIMFTINIQTKLHMIHLLLQSNRKQSTVLIQSSSYYPKIYKKKIP